MPATAGTLPIFIRVGQSQEAEIGTVDILSNGDAHKGTVSIGIDKAGFAALLREAADSIESLFPEGQ